MGLFDKFKRQLLKVIEWNDSSKDTIVYRYPLTGTRFELDIFQSFVKILIFFIYHFQAQ